MYFNKNNNKTTLEILINTIQTSKLNSEICNNPKIPKTNASVAMESIKNTQIFLQHFNF
jgi:hypothetical protein